MTKRKDNRILTEKHLFFGLLSVFVSLIAVYMYLVSATVMHVVLQTELQQETKQVQSKISSLENRLIVAQHKVSADIASLRGFTEVTDKVFIDRAPASLVLSDTSQPQ